MDFDAKSAVNSFVAATRADLASTSTPSRFPAEMQPFRQNVEQVQEILEADRHSLKKSLKALKDIQKTGDSHVGFDVQFADALEKIGNTALRYDPKIGTAFLKFSVVFKEMSSVTKNSLQALGNMVSFPLETLLKNDFKSINDEIKRNFDKALREHDTARARIEKEKRKAVETGTGGAPAGGAAAMTRFDPVVGSIDCSAELVRERRAFQLGMVDYLVKANEIRTKKGIEFVQHLMEYYHTHYKILEDGLKVLTDLGSWANTLSTQLNGLRSHEEEEKKELLELKRLIKAEMTTEKEQSGNPSGYNLHIPAGEEAFGMEKLGNLMKRSDGRLRKVFQKRYCQVKDGRFTMAHGSNQTPSATFDLLTSQVKEAPDTDGKKNCFNLVTPAGNRTYLFSAESSMERESWLSVIRNWNKKLLENKFDEFAEHHVAQPAVKTMTELVAGVIEKVKTLPGNDVCCDCSEKNPTWLSHNLGVLTCIGCSGIHREIGVQYSRVVSIQLDNLTTSKLIIARSVGNQAFNDIMEANLSVDRPSPDSGMGTRREFINAKYVQHRFIQKAVGDEQALLRFLAKAVSSKDIFALLQAFGEGADLCAPLPDSETGETVLHYAVSQDDGTSLHIVDFIIWNIWDRNNLSRQDAAGNTPLHLAVRQGKLQCVKLLLRGGANVNSANKDGFKPLYFAEENGYAEIIDLLKEASHKRLGRCENIRIDWGLALDQEQEEKIYDEPTECAADEDTMRVPKPNQRPVSTAIPQGQAPLPPGPFQRTSSLRDRERTSKTRGVVSPPAVLMPSSSRQSSVPTMSVSGGGGGGGGGGGASPQRKRAPPVPVHRSATTSTSSAPTTTTEDWKTHRRQESGPPGGNIVVQRTPKPMPPARLTPKRNVSYLKATKDETQDFVDGKKGNLMSPPPPPLPVKKQKSPPLPHGAAINGTMASSSGGANKITVTVPGRAAAGQPRVISSSNHRPGAVSEDPSLQSKIKLKVPVPPKRRVRKALAQFDCEADHPDELTFVEGEVIIIEEKLDNDWWFGHAELDDGRKGVFPSNYVKEID